MRCISELRGRCEFHYRLQETSLTVDSIRVLCGVHIGEMCGSNMDHGRQPQVKNVERLTECLGEKVNYFSEELGAFR